MKRLDATLELCKLLSPTYSDFEELEKIAQSDSSDWEEIIKVANRYILVPALYATLKRKELLEHINDEQLMAYMQEIYTLNANRNEAILKQTNELCTLLSTIDVKPILLKGAAALSESHYETIGERAMMDIDILVPEDKIFEVINLLKEKDAYKEIDETADIGSIWHHYRRLYKESGMTSVEVHRYPVHLEEIKYFPKEITQEFRLQSKSIENAYIIKPMYELYHSFLHSQIMHKYHEDNFLALRHIHHFTVMVMNYKDINWDELSQIIKDKKLTKTWEEYLFVLQTIFKTEIPIEIKERKQNLKYLQKVYKRVDLAGSKQLAVKIFIRKVLTAFSYEKLQEHYDFNNKLLLLIYIPRRMVYLIYAYMTNPKKIDSMVKGIRMLSN